MDYPEGSCQNLYKSMHKFVKATFLYAEKSQKTVDSFFRWRCRWRWER